VLFRSQDGYAAGQTAAKEEAARIGKAANELDQALQEFDQQVADELLALAVEIARQVVRKEIAARPEAILGIVNEALTFLPHQHAAIHLNPEDASLVRSYLGDVLTHAGHRILEEPALQRGDCLLEAGGSQIDASTATRWRRVVESLGISEPWDK
jgi:flagellar assembly protein FliH